MELVPGIFLVRNLQQFNALSCQPCLITGRDLAVRHHSRYPARRSNRSGMYTSKFTGVRQNYILLALSQNAVGNIRSHHVAIGKTSISMKTIDT